MQMSQQICIACDHVQPQLAFDTGKGFNFAVSTIFQEHTLCEAKAQLHVDSCVGQNLFP